MERLLDTLFLFLTKLYLAKGQHQTVVIAGSIGKTSTTQAIASVLSSTYRVVSTKQNYNTPRGVALTVFDQSIPTSRIKWLYLLLSALYKSIFRTPRFDWLVLELGTDKPGDLGAFAFLHPDIAVVTAVTPEHMEFFGSIDAVAKEELTVCSYATKTLINADLVDNGYVTRHRGDTEVIYYGRTADNSVKHVSGEVVIVLDGIRINSSEFALLGGSGESTLLASALVGKLAGMDGVSIKDALLSLRPVPGRMNKFAGKAGSVIVDDTYNSSPAAVRSALDYLYAQKATKRIALLGMMNEMGEESPAMHAQVGSWCDPKKLDLVVTLGKDANSYLAERAEKAGCRVIRAESPRQAGEIIAKLLSMGVVVLAKGSQNGVYAEEAVKLLLADKSDIDKLVRQHTYWPKKKADYFVNI